MTAEPPRPTRSSVDAWVAALIFAAVLIFRLIALSRFASSASWQPSGGDTGFYHEWARRITAGRFTDGHAFYGLPLYAYWLAAFYTVFGENGFAPLLVQCSADAATAVLVFMLGEQVSRWAGASRAAGRGPALAAGLACASAWAFYLPAQAYSIVRMPTSLGVFAFWLLVWLLIRWARRPSLGALFLCGLGVGVTAMAVATILSVLPLYFAALVWKWRAASANRWRGAAVGALALLGGVGVGTSPCWLHNTIVAGDRVFLSAHGGINLWIGNHPGAYGYPAFDEVRAGQAEALQDSIAIAERAAGKPLKRSEVSAYWSGKARAYIRENPGAWLRLLCTKVWNFWNAFQYDDLSIISSFRERGITLPGFGFGLAAAFALASLPFVLLTSASARWVFGAIVLHVVALLPVFVTERYRLVAAPGLIVLAVAGLCWFWQTCVGARFSRAAAYLVVLAAAVFAVSAAPVNPALWALDPYNTGREALDAGHLETAERKLELAYSYVPENAELNLALGNLWLARGDEAKARSFYRATLAADPRHRAALSNLGVMELQAQSWGRAIRLFEAAIEAEPHDAKSHYLLARALLGAGERARALSEAELALQITPAQPEFIALRDELSQP